MNHKNMRDVSAGVLAAINFMMDELKFNISSKRIAQAVKRSNVHSMV